MGWVYGGILQVLRILTGLNLGDGHHCHFFFSEVDGRWKGKHLHFTLQCVIYCENEISMHLLIGISKGT